MVRLDKTLEPNPAMHTRYQPHFARYNRLFPLLRTYLQPGFASRRAAATCRERVRRGNRSGFPARYLAKSEKKGAENREPDACYNAVLTLVHLVQVRNPVGLATKGFTQNCNLRYLNLDTDVEYKPEVCHRN